MWWCGILFGAGYFFEARLDSVVRTTFWAGQEYFLPRLNPYSNPRWWKIWWKPNRTRTRTESVRVQKAYQTQHDGEKNAYSFFTFYPYSTRTNPYRNIFSGQAGYPPGFLGWFAEDFFGPGGFSNGVSRTTFFPTPRNSIPERRNGKKYPFALTGKDTTI